MTCAPSVDLDQPGHPPSLIRVLAVRLMIAKDPMFLHGDREYSDQTGCMGHFVRFVVLWLVNITYSEQNLHNKLLSPVLVLQRV